MIRKKMSAGIWALVVLLSGLGMLGIFSVPVVAPPNMHFFSGSITYNALPAPAGTEVFAEIDGTLYGQDSVFGGTGGYDGSVYSLAVSGEDTANATAKEGGVNGQPVIFWVLVPGQPRPYIANQAPVYTDGNVDTLNLLVQSAGQPNMVTLNQVAPTNVSSDWVELYNPAAASNADLSADWGLEDSYGGAWGFTPADVLPPLGVSPVPHPVTLQDADGNVKLAWTDPLGTIAAGNPVVMDKVEYGPHIGDSEASGGDTIGLDKGSGSVWDPNLPNCGPEEGYTRIAAGVDNDVAGDWSGCGPNIPMKQAPQLWEIPPGYVSPLTGDTSTLFLYQVEYADADNDAPQAGSPTVDIYRLSTGPLPGSPFTMTFVSWGGSNPTPGDYVHPLGGAIYAYQTVLPVGVDWCYVFSATDVNLMTNSTLEICDPDVGDVTAPEIPSVTVNNLPSVSVLQGTNVDLRATIDDVNTGGSVIGGAEYSRDVCTWPGTNMGPQDGSYDTPTEVAFAVIDTTGWADATYTIYIRGWDVVPNYNETGCPSAEIIVYSVDTFWPNIFEPRVNTQTQVKVTPGTTVTFTAIVDDEFRGDNNIGGAMYSVNGGPDTAMNAQDGAFDNINETVTVDIDTTTWTTGPYTVCVSDAWDAALPTNNHNTQGTACATIDIDGTAPSVSNIRLDGITISHTVSVGSTTTLTANIDDSGLAGNSDIANASFSFEGAMGIAMAGTFDSPTEDVTYDIVTGVAPYVAGGPYTICVSGSDVLGNDNTNGACIQLTIGGVDDQAPVISALAVDGLSSKSVAEGTTVVFTGNADDTTMGPSNIQNASYIVRDSTAGVQATGPMAASDGSFGDSFSEDVTVDIDTTGWADDVYSVHLLACDIIPNCDYTEALQATLTVTIGGELEPPVVSNVAADTISFIEGSITTITLTANVDDTTTGGSNIGGANYTVGQAAWPGTLMDAADGAFDEISEDVTVDVDVFGWTDGTYDLYVYGSDEWGNSDTTITEFVTITVHPAGADITEPTMGTPTATSPEEGETATISITVSDDVSSGENLTVTITITGPGATPIVTNQDMGDPVGTTFSYETVALTDAGGYSYTITATDEAGNSDTRTGTFTVSEIGDQPDGIAWWIWLLLIIIIVVIVIVVIVAMRKKPEEEIPEAPLEEEEELLPEEELPPEEEAFVEEEIEEAPPEEVVEEAPPEEVVEEPAPAEEAPMEEEAPAEEAPAEEAPAEEEAAPGGPISCPNCGTVNPEGISVCTSCGSPL